MFYYTYKPVRSDKIEAQHIAEQVEHIGMEEHIDKVR